jgi:hypothetical protein
MAMRAVDMEQSRVIDSFDNPMAVIQRIKKCLGQVRNLKKAIDRYGPYDQVIGSSEPTNPTLARVARDNMLSLPRTYNSTYHTTHHSTHRTYRGKEATTPPTPDPMGHQERINGDQVSMG